MFYYYSDRVLSRWAGTGDTCTRMSLQLFREFNHQEMKMEGGKTVISLIQAGMGQVHIPRVGIEHSAILYHDALFSSIIEHIAKVWKVHCSHTQEYTILTNNLQFCMDIQQTPSLILS